MSRSAACFRPVPRLIAVNERDPEDYERTDDRSTIGRDPELDLIAGRCPGYPHPVRFSMLTLSFVYPCDTRDQPSFVLARPRGARPQSATCQNIPTRSEKTLTWPTETAPMNDWPTSFQEKRKTVTTRIPSTGPILRSRCWGLH